MAVANESPELQASESEAVNPPEPNTVVVPTEPIVSDSEDATPTESAPPKKEFAPLKPPKKKKTWLIILILLVLIAAGVGVWLMMIKKNTATSPQTNTNQSQTTTTTNTYTPTEVAYAYKDTDTNPYTLYTRPVSGGDRLAADLKLTSDDGVYDNDVNGTSVVVATSNNIYVSTDAGKTYKSVLTVNKSTPKDQMGNQITSIKLSTDGQRIVYGWLADNSTNVVKSINLEGQDTKDLFTSKSRGVFINAYNSQKQQILYSEGCYNCDGNSFSPLTLRDIKADKTTTVVKASTTESIISLAIDKDFSTIVYAISTINDKANAASGGGIGDFTAAPYTIKQVDLGSNKVTKVTSFGTKDEKNTNGTYRSRQVYVGFVAGTSTLFYTNDAQIYEIKSGSPSLVYEATSPILYEPFVGMDTIIAAAGGQTADYILNSYNISTKKSVKILSGDNNTVLFGVTTK